MPSTSIKDRVVSITGGADRIAILSCATHLTFSNAAAAIVVDGGRAL